MLRKSFLIIGVVLLVLGFFFFYWASRVNWDYVMEYKNTADVGGPALVSDYGFGKWYAYPVYTPTLEMLPNDFLTVRCSDINETVYIVLFENPPSNTTVLIYGTGLVSYTSHQNNLVFVSLYLAIPTNQNTQNATLSTTTTLNHYGTPQWVYLGIGVVLSSLAVVSIVKSLSKLKPCSTEGFFARNRLYRYLRNAERTNSGNFMRRERRSLKRRVTLIVARAMSLEKRQINNEMKNRYEAQKCPQIMKGE